MNKHLLVGIGISVASMGALPVNAETLEICSKYVVSNGDTLRSIAKDTYGSERDYRYLYIANRSALGLSPHIIETGMSLDIPCVEGSPKEVAEPVTAPDPIVSEPVIEIPVQIAEVGPSPAPAPVITETAPEFLAAPEPTVAIQTPSLATFGVESAPSLPSIETTAKAPVVTTEINTATEAEAEATAELVETIPSTQPASPNQIVTVGFVNNTPYSDPDIHLGGLTSAIVHIALIRGGASDILEPVFVERASDDVATANLPDNFSLSYPWLRPDCTLSDFDIEIKNLCDNYTFSAPIHEEQMTMFVLHEGPFHEADTVDDLVGTRICRPSSLSTYDLISDGMIEPIVTLKTAADIGGCFNMLVNGETDVVSVNGLSADVYFSEFGKDPSFWELPAFATIRTVHAIAPKDDPAAEIAMNQLNSGLWEMLASGEWGEIAMNYLTGQLE